MICSADDGLSIDDIIHFLKQFHFLRFSYFLITFFVIFFFRGELHNMHVKIDCWCIDGIYVMYTFKISGAAAA